MKHASQESLDRLEALLEQVRQCPGLTERKRGVFYLRSAAFLHFHEDTEGLFADLKVNEEWQRLGINTRTEWKGLVRTVRVAVK